MHGWHVVSDGSVRCSAEGLCSPSFLGCSAVPVTKITTGVCSGSSRISSYDECVSAASADTGSAAAVTEVSSASVPAGCYKHLVSSAFYFNTAASSGECSSSHACLCGTLTDPRSPSAFSITKIALAYAHQDCMLIAKLQKTNKHKLLFLLCL